MGWYEHPDAADDEEVVAQIKRRAQGEPDECTDGAPPEEHAAAIELLGQCPWCGRGS